ncbi:bifunctional hydroxymethylpyrimidine kinase/phosphomethylpyrimidine kinase [Leptolyngbya sp. 15MV]|nr:bifunctional hydroxymethylpyrimidine kinase/phosphomethylpyrimidine kinase [Leptolyngbya sp. 15MV]
MSAPPRILAIAGSDSSGGAGLQADVKTITMLGGYAMTAITAVTAQNTLGVQAVETLPSEFVAAQIDACLADIGADAVKIGMLGSPEIANVVAELFPALAKALFVNPFAPRIFARIARVPGETGRFLARSTGSRIDAEGLRCYETLLGNSRHCRGALDMMASWDLERLDRALPGVANPVLLVHSHGDSAIPLASVQKAAARLRDCTLEVTPSLGHLAHEEDPGHYARRIIAYAGSHGI